MTQDTLVAVVLALQFAAFGWRINREIPVGDEGRRTWLPVSDIFNILSMVAVVWVCIVLPLAGHKGDKLVATVLAAAYTLIALHPINIAAHYRLFTREGRHKYTRQGKDWPYITDYEMVSLFATVVVTVIVIWFVY